jgi:DnaJ domain
LTLLLLASGLQKAVLCGMSKAEFGLPGEKPVENHRACDRQLCSAEGEYRAPKSRLMDRGGADDYMWLCLAHIREFNKSWNFFDGMSDDEVLRYKDEDITGHRPTWQLGSRTSAPKSAFQYDDPFDFQKEAGFGEHAQNDRRKSRNDNVPGMDPEDRVALATLNLQPGCTIIDIKKRRKELAKKYHPDIRGGDKQAEEILKNINQAYSHLLSCGTFQTPKTAE